TGGSTHDRQYSRQPRAGWAGLSIFRPRCRRDPGQLKHKRTGQSTLAKIGAWLQPRSMKLYLTMLAPTRLYSVLLLAMLRCGGPYPVLVAPGERRKSVHRLFHRSASQVSDGNAGSPRRYGAISFVVCEFLPWRGGELG